MTKTYIDELVEEIATLRNYYNKAITGEREMAEKFNNAYWENLQLKELLSKAKGMLSVYRISKNQSTYSDKEVLNLLTQIDEALK